jgi:hypothetical protein
MAELPPDRRFGLFFAAAFAALAVWLALRHRPVAAIVACAVVGIAFAVLALAAPQRLRPLNRAWYALGMALGRIVNPVVLGVLYFALITPIALLMRLAGRDPLRLRPRAATTYWIDRDPPGPAPRSLDKQY